MTFFVNCILEFPRRLKILRMSISNKVFPIIFFADYILQPNKIRKLKTLDINNRIFET